VVARRQVDQLRPPPAAAGRLEPRRGLDRPPRRHRPAPARRRVVGTVVARRTRLVYASRRGDLFTIGGDGRGNRPLLAGAAAKAPAGWSPDGSRILFTAFDDPTGRTASVFVVGADGTHPRRLGSGFAACWSPDGSRILYTTAFASPLLAMDADGSDRRVVARGPGSEPDWR